MEKICYKTNPIKEVIARLDFLNHISQLRVELPKDFVLSIKKLFPIGEYRDLVSKELQIKGADVHHKDFNIKEWRFFNKERTNKLYLAENTLVLSTKKYSRYDDFFSDFKYVINAFCETYPDFQFKRFGLRYINSIQIDEPNPFDWKKYINSNMLSIFKIPENKNSIARALQNLELKIDDFNLRFQFGMHNPDFPLPIKKKIFILDLDAYYGGVIGKTEVEQFYPQFHKEIQGLFERSITDHYRDFLGYEQE